MSEIIESHHRVLITGASGFLGGRIVEAMRLSGFATPVGTVRRWTRAARPGRLGAEVVLCDICDEESVNAAVQGVDAIVHCAYTDDRESIVGGTRNLLNAAKANGVKRFVFLSSAEVYDTTTKGAITEDSPTESEPGKLYKNCKVEAEQVCREFMGGDLGVTILRPSLIYGPFGQSWSIDVADRLQSGKWGLFDDRDGIANLIYVDDVVRSIFLALQEPAAAGEAFNINGPEKVTWNEYFQMFNDILGLPPLSRISASKSGLRTMVMDFIGNIAYGIVDRFEDQLMEIYLKGGLASRIMKAVKGELKATPSGTELNDLYQRQFHLTQDKARDLLGFEPKFSLEEGVGYTAKWLQLHEKLKQPLPSSIQRLQDETESFAELASS